MSTSRLDKVEKRNSEQRTGQKKISRWKQRQKDEKWRKGHMIDTHEIYVQSRRRGWKSPPEEAIFEKIIAKNFPKTLRTPNHRY